MNRLAAKPKILKTFKVTFKFRKLPWYTVTGIDVQNKTEALRIATKQMYIEIGKGHKMAKPVVEMTSSIYAEASFGAEG